MTAPFEKLAVWQLAHSLALRIYRATANFPSVERYGLTSQLRRAAVAVAANIVEGNARNHRAEYVQFCNVARASAVEVKYLLRLSHDLSLLPAQAFDPLHSDYDQLGALLHSLSSKLRLRAS
jgi:four helix bundle protein